MRRFTHITAAGIILAFIVLFPLCAHAEDATYVGAKKCKTCHQKQFTTWSTTKMAGAFELLKPGVRAEQKKLANQDPAKDYTHDPTCLACHTTGYGKPGGFKSIEETPDLAGIQCEACHGPHSNVLKIMTIQNKEYKKSEVVQAGLVIPTENTCKGLCHNEKSPFIKAGYKFDFETRKKQGTHEHLPLKFPHG